MVTEPKVSGRIGDDSVTGPVVANAVSFLLAEPAEPAEMICLSAHDTILTPPSSVSSSLLDPS